MESRKGVVLKNPTMAQRKAIVAIANSEGIEHGDNILNESYPWIWFSNWSEKISGCKAMPMDIDKYVSFEKFVEYMYQDEEVIPIAIWKCTKELKTEIGQVSFKEGRVYEEDKNIHVKFALIDEQGDFQVVGKKWRKHFYQVK